MGMGDASFTLLDGAILLVLFVALLRGFFIGLIRESFSIAALAGAVLVTRATTAPAAELLQQWTDGEIGPALAPWLAGTAIAIATVAVIALLGRVLRRGARLAGLRWADRVGGAALGAAEGAVIAMVIVLGATWTVGRTHPQVAESRSLEAYDVVRSFVEQSGEELPDVAAPPGDWRERRR